MARYEELFKMKCTVNDGMNIWMGKKFELHSFIDVQTTQTIWSTLGDMSLEIGVTVSNSHSLHLSLSECLSGGNCGGISF